MANKTDDKTMQLIAQVAEKKKAIAKAEKPSYKTNCSFSYIEGVRSSATNIHVESDLRKLVSMAAFLQDRTTNYDKAAKELGVNPVPEFTWDGYTVAEWMGDLKMRVMKIQIEAEKKKLTALEARLDKIISPEKRAELELAAIEAELG